MTKKFVVNSIACDWLTVTTFNQTEILRMKILSNQIGNALHPQSIMQYDGIKYERGFFGIGMQSGKENAMMTVEGWDADRVIREFDLSKCNLPRVDVQLTIDKPKDYSYTKERSFLDENIKYNPEVRGWDSNRGGSTIYIGAPTSDKQSRMYEKGDAFEFLRFEVQLRRTKAKAYKRHAEKSGINDANKRALTDAMQFVSEGCSVDLFKRAIDNRTVLLPEIKKQNDTNKRRWLRSATNSMIKYALESEDNKRYIVTLLEQVKQEI